MNAEKLFEVIGRQTVEILMLQERLRQAEEKAASLHKQLGDCMRAADEYREANPCT